MDEIIKKLDEAYSLMSDIFVRRNDVELMATAKLRLVEACRLAEKKAKEAEKSDGQTD